MQKIYCVGLALLIAGVLNCGGGGNGGGGNGGTENFFFSAANDTTPVFAPASKAGASLAKAATWSFGSVNYELFNTFREYINSRDEGDIGLDNIYKVLYQTGSFYSEAEGMCTPSEGAGESVNKATSFITEETAIDSPFDFGNAETYTCAINDADGRHGYAIKEVGGTKYGLLSWQVLNYDNNNSDEKGVLQGSYNETTGALDLDMAVYVNYVDQGDYSLRTEIIGNAQTHQFSLRLMKYNSEQGAYWISLVGYGISQGAGNYFLFKVSDQSGVTDKYYCYAADADETTLQAADDAGSDTAPENCADYQDEVGALTAFASTDLPTQDSNFNTGNAQEGTIYLNH